MDESSIGGKAEKLGQEIEVILQEEHSYRSRKGHSLAENADHDKRQFRILTIREELGTLLQKARQQSSHGSVWYS